MAKYPVESDDNVGVIDALNYLLSGPAGLGQNFAGSSAYQLTSLSGNFRPPFNNDSYQIDYEGYINAGTLNVLYIYGDGSNLTSGMFILAPTVRPNTYILSIGSTVGGITPITMSQTAVSPFIKTNVYFSTNTENLYVPAIPISTCTFIDDRTFEVTFASTQSIVPFSKGNPVILTGVTGDTYWNQRFYQIGIISCTTTSCLIRTDVPVTGITDGTGGSIYLTVTNSDSIISAGLEYTSSTDANGKVTVTGPSDRVFISAQIDMSYWIESIISLGSPGYVNLTISLNRYKAILNNDSVNPDYLFEDKTTISEKVYLHYDSGSGVIVNVDVPSTVFSSVVDSPGPGYYWYILEITFQSSETLGVTDFEVVQVPMTLRSLSAQVVKQ